MALNEPLFVSRESVLDATITHDGLDYEGYNDKIVTRVHSRTSSKYLDEGMFSLRNNRREVSRYINEYPISGVRQLECKIPYILQVAFLIASSVQLKETQNLFSATMRRTELLCNSLLETQAELARVYEQRDSYMDDVHDLQGELKKTEAQLEEVEARNYTLTTDYEALGRDNACLRRYLDELSEELQDTLSKKVCRRRFKSTKSEICTYVFHGRIVETCITSVDEFL
ncbi:hypothetical protein C0992_002424 [Termitomyces sp. T32_za158]|nr:hypothetical protein C0992_002424 [Termitomyces sp. T32_za158]